MQYVRSISGSVSKTWNSINPATLSGAIDVIVVEQEDGSLACSPFHVRFGKFSLLRPYEKKVEFRVNDSKQDYSMKLGEGGEAFFVFETLEDIPEALQTSPLVSPAISPVSAASAEPPAPSLQEPDFLDLSTGRASRGEELTGSIPLLTASRRAQSDLGDLTPLSQSPDELVRPVSGDWPGALPLNPPLERSTSDQIVPIGGPSKANSNDQLKSLPNAAATDTRRTSRSTSPPPLPIKEAVDRAKALSQKLSGSNIPSQVTDTGDLKLDMTGYKSSEEETIRAEVIARKILSEELEGPYDIGSLIGADENGDLWIYSSEEAKEAAGRKAGGQQFQADAILTSDASSDPGYHSDGDKMIIAPELTKQQIPEPSSVSTTALITPPQTPPENTTGATDSIKNYAKTLRLTSDQLKSLNLHSGANSMSFTVNKATCQASMFFWKHDVPIVISDIDGTITKSDALGHVLNMIGRDWTHLGVAKLYTDIVANGYNILYLTSRSVGQADTTRGYLKGVIQEGYKLPNGPVIMSPDRTYAALRREVYLRKPEVFKMSCLRDILHLFAHRTNPFYAGFGNRLTDALSYRSVNIPLTRIFTINSNAEVSLELLSLNKYKISYVSMREIVDQYFPPVGLLIASGGEEYTDFNYWREPLLDIDEFSSSDESDDANGSESRSIRSEDEGSEEGLHDEVRDEEDMAESFLSQGSVEIDEENLESMIESSVLDEHSIQEGLVLDSSSFRGNSLDLPSSRPSVDEPMQDDVEITEEASNMMRNTTKTDKPAAGAA